MEVLLFGARAAARPIPLDLEVSVALDSIVLASGRGSELRADCPGYIAPLAAALKPTVRSDSAPARARVLIKSRLVTAT